MQQDTHGRHDRHASSSAAACRRSHNHHTLITLHGRLQHARTTPRIIHAACASAGGGVGLSGRRKIRTRAVGSSPPEPRRKAASEDDVLLLLAMECNMP